VPVKIKDPKKRYEASDAANAAAKAWLTANFPKWEDDSAYWD
jgi:hypothetical protein